MKKTTVLFALIVFAAASLGLNAKHASAYTFRYQKDPEVKELLKTMHDYPAARFAVMSDLHYYDASLGTSGKAFEDYLADDRKLLRQSGEILDEGIKIIGAEKADFILVPGDLTKDGEKINHQSVKRKLDVLAARVRKIYVVPGNHDIMNGHAKRYRGDTTEPVDTVSSEDFRKIYAAYGYAAPVASDKASLSYVVEPVGGLWVLALDSCLWRKQKPGGNPITDGEFTNETMQWIEDILIRSKREKKAVIAFMHHGIVEHYPHNEKFYGAYIVNNAEEVAGLFAAYGVRMVFTGHFHAQDITLHRQKDGKQFVFDIETGSFVTYPCPFRVVSISKGQQARIESRFIGSIASMRQGFRQYARRYVFEGTVGMADKALKGYRVSKKDMRVVSPVVAEAYVVHLTGDEKKPEKMFPEGLGLMGKVVMRFQGNLIKGWYTDLPPADGRIVIDLKTGEWK